MRAMWVWFLLLPTLFQIAYYKPETGPLYALSKASPMLLLPFTIYGMFAIRLPDMALYICFIVYSLTLTPILSMLYLPNDLLEAVLATVKAWPVMFYFTTIGALVLLRASERNIARAALSLGWLTLAAMLTLWIVIPTEWYQPGAFGANLFSWDEGRGNYIRMPMMLGELSLFWLGQRFGRERKLWQILLLAAGIIALVTIYKARTPIGVTLLILLFTLFNRLPSRWRWGLGALATGPLGLAALIAAPSVPNFIATTFDESLFIRLRSATVAWRWMEDSPLKLLFGSGSTSTSSKISMADVLGYQDFWITDIGWLGVLLEYGLVGTGLIIAIHVRALLVSRRVRGHSAFRSALADYVLFELLCSGIYSVMYSPGPVVTVAAICTWLAVRDRAGLGVDETGLTKTPASASAPTPEWAAFSSMRGWR